MTSAYDQFEVGSKVLGYVGFSASWRRMAQGYELRNKKQPMLVISTCASTDEGVHEPAASITINNRVGLLALREAIDEALKEYP